MPKIFEKRGFKFFFYSNEGNEPPHVHVKGHGGRAKFWLTPVDSEFSQRLSIRQLTLLRDIIRQKKDLIMEKWNEHFKSK